MKTSFELGEDLLTACLNRDKDTAESLILQGADVNYEKFWHGTPLFYAIHANDIEMIKLLLKHGADAKKEVRLLGGSIDVIVFARYTEKNEELANFLEWHS